MSIKKWLIKKIIMKALQWIWDTLNGNKTIIFTVLLYLVEADAILVDYKDVSLKILMLLAGGSLVHHVGKGSFRSDKDIEKRKRKVKP